MKRIFSLFLALVLLGSMLPQLGITAHATEIITDPEQIEASRYTTVYAEKLDQIFRGEVELFSNSTDKYPLGSSLKNSANYYLADTISGQQCYIYAQGVYYYLFGDVIYHGDGYKYWSDSAKVLTNLKTVSYSQFQDAGVGFGAYIRTTGNSNGSYSSNEGHSMIVLEYNEENITVLEGNADGRGLIRVTVLTWDEFNNNFLTAKGRRVCHIVQCLSAMCEHPEYGEEGDCGDCGEEFDFAATFNTDCLGYYTVSQTGGVLVNTQKPYLPEQGDGILLEEGVQLQVHGCVTNAQNETWYQVSTEELQGYVAVDSLTLVEYLPQQIIGSLTSPVEGASLYQASYPVEGKITSLYPLQEVVGELDGNVFATVTLGEATELNIQNSDINRKLSFASLAPGSHTLVLKARDIHRQELAEICVRTFTILEADQAQESAAVILKIARNEETGKPVLSWEKVSGARKYEVYRATSENGKYSRLTTTTKLTYTDTKATAGKMYFYKIRIKSGEYNNAYSTIATCHVACAKPTVTTSVDAATGMPKLSWKTVTGAKSYRIFRSLPGEAEYTLLAEQTAKSYLDLQAPVDTKCSYRVQAVGSSSELNSKPTAVQVTATFPRSVVKTDVTQDGQTVISWSAVEGAIGYKLYRSTSSSKSYSLILETADTTYMDPVVTAGKVYYYKVVVVGRNTASAQSSYAKAVGKCAVPDLEGTTNASGKPVLSWNKVTGAKKYEIYRSVNGASFKRLTTTTKLTYTDTKATAGANCTYQVRAAGSKSAYNSDFSEAWGCDVVCAAPSVTVKVDTATGKPGLSWKKISGATSYEIYRSVNGGEYTLCATVTTASFKDTGAKVGDSCSYQVVALGKAEVFNSAASAVKTALVVCGQPKLSGKTDAAGKPQISWKAVQGAQEYAVYRSTSKSKGYQVVGYTAELTYTDASAVKNKTYYYKVVALAENTQSAQSGYVKVKAKK